MTIRKKSARWLLNGMSTIKKMTLEEIKNIPPMTEAERNALKNSPITYDEESPKLSKEELSQFRNSVMMFFSI